MAAKLAEAFIEVGTRDQKMRAGLKSVQNRLGGFVRKMAPIAAGLGVALGLKEAISSTRTQIEAEKKLAAVLKATGGAAGLTAKEIKDYAGDLQKATNFGDEMTISAAGILATFKQIKGDVFKDVLAVAQDVSEVMGQDLKSSVTQLGKAMNDPATGLTMLTRIGITFTDQQKEQIKALQKSGDLLGAQGVIMKELQSQFGGAAKAMADPLTQAQNKLGDIGEGIGNLVLPSINAMADAFLGSGVEGENFADRMLELGQDIAFIFKNLGTTVKITTLGWADSLLEAVPMMTGPIEDVAVAFTGAFAGMKAFFASYLDFVKAGFTEMGNLAKAIGSGMAAAMKSAMSGDVLGATQAFSDAFMDTLASQKDAVAKDPYDEFVKESEKASAKMRATFEKGGGIGGIVKAQLAEQEKILADAMAEEEKRRAKQKELREFTPGGGAEAGAPAAAKAREREKIGFAGITDLSRQIQANVGLTKEQKEARKTAANTESIAETNKAIAAAVKQLATNPLGFALV